MMLSSYRISVLVVLVFLLSNAFGQTDFKLIKTIPCTPVKNQYRSNTCWSFSAIALIESDLLRMGKPAMDLSEMYIVKHTYIAKAEKYVRLHGHLNFSGGGEFNDVIEIIKRFGIVPESIYSGKPNGEENHNHSELDNVLKGYIDALVKNKAERLTPYWSEGFELILNAYLGTSPNSFKFEGKEYTPLTFSKSLGINYDDYILLTSFSHHPYYAPFILELPDNWSWGKYYNLPLDEFQSVIYDAVMKDYPVASVIDISEDYFKWNRGIAQLPKDLTAKDITPEKRQIAFDNHETTDDHGMLIVGIAKDSSDKTYYYMKNSWGFDNDHKGYVYVSEDYLRYKTLAVMINKNALPVKLLNKLEIK
jgi:bleomycin hydrolase